jgi:hypothetical protein
MQEQAKCGLSGAFVGQKGHAIVGGGLPGLD